MKSFFTILVLLVVLGYAALLLGVIGVVVYVLGVVAAIIAMLMAQQDQQRRIEEKLDRLLSAREHGEEKSAEEELPVSGDEPEDSDA